MLSFRYFRLQRHGVVAMARDARHRVLDRKCQPFCTVVQIVVCKQSLSSSFPSSSDSRFSKSVVPSPRNLYISLKGWRHLQVSRQSPKLLNFTSENALSSCPRWFSLTVAKQSRHFLIVQKKKKKRKKNEMTERAKFSRPLAPLASARGKSNGAIFDTPLSLASIRFAGAR